MARRLGHYVALVLLALMIVPVPAAFATARRAAPAACSWVQMTSRSPGATDNDLNAVAAIAPDNVWAVGEYFVGVETKTLIEHWNGKSWQVVFSPNKGTGDSLFSVYASSPTSVWAVGSYSNGTAGRTLIEHWNGTSWKVVASPNVGAGSNELRSVRGSSGRDIWAVGDAVTSYPLAKTVILHWNGRRWQVTPSPNVSGRPNFLAAVRPLSPTEAWAVGRYVSASGNSSQTLILRWSKDRWRLVSSPNGPAGASGNSLTGVLVTSAASAWAVGSYFNGTTDRTLFLHWNGRHWLKSFSPNTGSESDDVTAVGATSATNIYVVGTAFSGISSKVLVVHWNGTHWRVMPGRSPGTSNILNGVFALSAHSIWAVGTTASTGGHNRTLIEHCR